MRILIVNRHIDDIAGGSETQCHAIAVALAARGHFVVYAACSPRDAARGRADGPRKDADRRLPYLVLPLRGAFRSAFEHALAETRPDVIYWRYNKKKLLGSVLAARRRGIKFVFAVSHINDIKPFAVKPFHGRRRGLLPRTARAATRLRTRATSALNYCALYLVDGVLFQHAGQIPTGFRRTHAVIYNSAPSIHGPPPTRKTAPAAESELAPAAACGSAPGLEQCPAPEQRAAPPYVLWIANLKKSKNPEEFLRLSCDLQHMDVEFTMVGDIQHPAYEPMVLSPSLPRNFRYLGFRPPEAVDALMRNCLFLAHTCDPEGFPNVFIQAWAHGKAVVSFYFDPGGLLETNGIGFCSGNYETFKRDVVRLITERDLREEIGAKAFRFAAENCDPDRNVEQLEKLLHQLVGPSAT